MKTVRDFTTGNISKIIISFYVPMFFTNMLQQVYNFADTAIVGNGLGDNALAAVGNMGSLTFAVIGFSLGLSIGFSVLIAQYFGAKEYEKLKESIAASVLLSVLLTIFLTLFSNIFLKTTLEFLQTEEEIMADSLLYGHIIFWGLFATIAYNMSSSILRAFGDSETPLIAIVISTVLNIILDYLAIFIWKTGVEGAAMATVFSQAISSLICIRKITKIFYARFETRHFLTSIQLYLQLLKNGIPMAIMNSITAVGCMVVQYFVNGFGVMYTAAYSACVKYLNVAMNPAYTAGHAMQAFTSQNYGAKRFDRIQKAMFTCLGIVLFFYVLFGGAMFFFARPLADVFLESEKAIQLTIQFLKISGITIFIVDVMFIFRMGTQAMEYSFIPMMSGVAEMFLRIGTIVLFASSIGFKATAFAEVAAWTGALLINGIAFFYYLSKEKRSVLQSP